jgi:hypothetical protein
MLEQTAGQVCGITPQREGAVSQYEAVGNVQRTVIQSNLVTENWFFQHTQVKKRVVERVCNLMKIAWADGKKAGFILGDGAFKLLDVFPNIALNDYGIYVNEGAKDDAVKQAITQLSQSALQSGNIQLLDVIKVLKADSLTEAEHVLENGLKEMQMQAQAQQQQQQEMMQAQAQEAEAQRQHELNLKNIDAEAKLEAAKEMSRGRIEVASIQADVDADVNSDKLRASIQQEAVQSDYNQITEDKKKELEEKKMAHQKEESQKDRALKEKEMEAKKREEKKKKVEKTKK